MIRVLMRYTNEEKIGQLAIKLTGTTLREFLTKY